MHIIVDRRAKRRRLMMDSCDTDVLGIGQARANHSREVAVESGSINPIHKFLSNNSPKSLLGHMAYCLTDRKEMITGKITDVIPPDMIMLHGGKVAYFKDVVSIS